MSIYDQSQPDMDSAYASALEDVAPGITSIVADQTQGDENWWDALSRALPIIATTAQQAQIIKIQTDRAKAGLPPLKASEYGVGVQVGVSDDVQKLLIYGAVGIAAMFLLHHVRR